MRRHALAAIGIALFSVTAFGQTSLPMRWEQSTGPHLPQALHVLDAKPNILCAALKSGGVVIYELADSGEPRVIAAVAKKSLANLDAMNLDQHGDYLYVALGDFFRKGSHAGVAIINVKTPSKPVVTSVWKSPKPMEGSAAITTDGKHVFLGVMSHGVLALNVSDPKTIKLAGFLLPDIHFPRKNPGAIAHPNARGLVLRSDLLYVANDAGGLRVLNVKDPSAMKEVGRYINPQMVGKQQAYNNLVLDGSKAYIAIDYAGLDIVDISTPSRVRQLGWWNPWRAGTPHNLWFNSPGHTNQIVYDSTRKQVLMSAGDSELLVVDVSRPATPRLVAMHGKPANKRGVWGLTVTTDQIFLAYIRTIIPFRGEWSGIKSVAYPARLP